MPLASALVLAAVTDKLADFATNVVGDLGLPGIFLLMAPESACIPIPSEATMLFAGFNVSEGRYSLWAAVLVAAVVLALVITGVVSARLGGMSPTRQVARNVTGGLLAMAVTYGIGVLVGPHL